jgi:hypothetical protein
MKKVVYVATLGKNVSINSYEADYDEDIGLYNIGNRTCPRDEMGKPRVGSVWGRTPHEVIAATHDWLYQREKEITESIRKTNRVRNALSDFTTGVAYQGFIIDSAKRGIAG